MNFYGKLLVSLGLVSGIAAGLLSYTYEITAPTIELRGREEQEKALLNVFFLQAGQEEGKTAFLLRPQRLAEGVTALYSGDDPENPAYYASVGSAPGYNSSVPVTLMVGFTGPANDAAVLLDGYADAASLPPPGEKGLYIVGFSVISSEETPGLGERIKDARPPYTWVEFLGGNRPPASPDTATPFQRQVRAHRADRLALRQSGGDLDAITASTITSNAVLAAIKDAGEKLEAALGSGR